MSSLFEKGTASRVADGDSREHERYNILTKIGKGTYGYVCKAFHTKTNTLVAIKIINLEDAGDEVEDVHQEIAVMSNISCPQLTKYFSSFVHGANLWIIMEYLEAGSLLDLIKESGPLSEPFVAYIMRELLSALAYLHAVRKIHRDVKAGNILVAANGSVKLAGFETMKQLTDSIDKRQSKIGTPFWMAPEVISQSAYDGCADVWSAGITAIELCTGAPPYANRIHPFQAVLLIWKNPPPVLEGTFSDEFKDFAASCLVKVPASRPSAVALLRHPFIAGVKGVPPAWKAFIHNKVENRRVKSTSMSADDVQMRRVRLNDSADRVHMPRLPANFRCPVNVLFWDRGVSQRLTLENSLAEFKATVKCYFEEELDDSPFRIYTLPAMDSLLELRKLIETEEDYDELKLSVVSLQDTKILVFRHEDIAPTKLPILWTNYKALKPTKELHLPSAAKAREAASIFSRNTRDRMRAKECRAVLDRHTCVLCRFSPHKGTGLAAVHIFTIKEFKLLRQPVRKLLFLSYGLVFGLNDFANMLTLCKCCHKHFDSHKVCIHATSDGVYIWDIHASIRSNTTISGAAFSSFHAQSVVFPHRPERVVPTLGVVQHRLRAAQQDAFNIEREDTAAGLTRRGRLAKRQQLAQVRNEAYLADIMITAEQLELLSNAPNGAHQRAAVKHK